MRKSASWMVLWDDRLLELARAEGSISPKKAVESGYVDLSPSQTGRRLRKLAEHGMMRELGNGVYAITEEGEQYLEGELNASDLTDISEEGEGTADA